ncbi:MAG: hypothetical protein WC249_03500 [Patescibacteria group bacterium]|jgi:hypothetical protein
MINFQTPILFLIYNRLETTQRVFEAIRRAQPKQLFVAADGPRLDREGDKEKCGATRRIIEQIDWDCEVKTLFREENLGCKTGVSSAINWFFENVEEGIILEDDCLPIDSFFPFCQLMLEKYRNNSSIGMIAGTNYLFSYNDFQYSYYLSKHCYVWGWATWKRAWSLYDLSISHFPENLFLRNYLQDSLSSNYYLDQFDYFKFNKIDTWDIQWSATLMKNKLYSIVPVNNQISNIGLAGTHTEKKVSLSINMPSKAMDIDEIKHPPTVVYDNVLDLVSMKNIVYKVIKTPVLKTLLIKIINRKNINFLKKIWPFKLYYYVGSKK